MAACLLFVFAALIEFAFVNVYFRVEKRRKQSNTPVNKILQKIQNNDEVITGCLLYDYELDKR